MMSQRTVTGLLLGLAALVLLWIGGTVLSIAAAVMICVGLYEEFHALAQAGHRPVSWPTGVSVALVIPVVLAGGVEAMLPLMIGVCLVTLVCIIFRREPRLEDVAMSLLPLFTVLLPGMCVISIIQVWPRPLQLTLLALLIVVPCVGDILAMQVGTLVRGPKLCPAVSPNKTISGAIGGLCGSLVAAIVVGIVAAILCKSDARALLPPWWEYLILGLLGGAISQLGDLCFSLIKRHCGIKDFSNLFPGHGGMLDRLDSILFMALVVFCYYLLVYI